MKLVEVLHKECGKPAFKAEDRVYVQGEPIKEGMLYYLDGTVIPSGTRMRCESCDHTVNLSLDGTMIVAENLYI